jgi:predicted ATPase/class 3 adenylate cyclase
MANRSATGEVLPPSGTVTFLFSDIEGSTRRWDRHRAAMQEAVRLHDGLMRDAIAAQGGFVFKTIGDAFCAAFARPEAAVAAALAAQLELAAADFSAVDGLRVRMAANTGTTDEREGDYFGPAVNRVARLLAIAHGGQVLLSAATAGLVHENPPPGASFTSLGTHALKDLERPEAVYQLVAPGLRRDFPALRSQKAHAHNLPAETSSFVGRVEEALQVTALVGRHRLVTVAGPGGIGKTRLTVHVARSLAEAWPDGVCFVELASISEGDLVPNSIAAALGAPLAADAEPEAGLLAALGRKHLLLVIDNSEHVVHAVGAIVAAILRSCAGVNVLASSRQPLGNSGEAVFRMPALALPPVDETAALDAVRARAFDAVALFVARAEAADSTFRFGDEIAPAVARICRKLDGIPLAIELAAARLRLLGARGLEERLERRFRVLVGGGRDSALRQQTLQATIDWSYELLAERERIFFRRLGPFVDGFSAEAAEFVASEGELDEDDAFELLTSLDDKSLIVADVAGEATRFRLLDSMRAYARERAEQQGESERDARRHLTYFRKLAEAAEAQFLARGNDTAYTLALAPDVGNLRAALVWSLAGGDVAEGAALATAIGRPWFRLGFAAEGIARVEAFIREVPPSGARLLARLWTELSWLAGSSLRSARAYEAASEAVRYARIAAEPATSAWALAYFAVAATRSRRFDEAEAALTEARALAGPDAAPGQRLTELEIRAFLANVRTDLEAAAAAYGEQLALLRSIGDEYGAAAASAGLAETEHARGNTQRAIELVREVLPQAARLLGRELHASVLANLAGYLLASDEIEAAGRAADESVALLAERDPSSAYVSVALEHKALVLALEGRLEAAARLEYYCDAALAAIGYEREGSEAVTHRRLTALLHERLGADELRASEAFGAALRPEAAIEASR